MCACVFNTVGHLKHVFLPIWVMYSRPHKTTFLWRAGNDYEFTRPCWLPQLCDDSLSSNVLHLHFPFPPTPNLCSPPLFLNPKVSVKAFFFPLYPVFCFDVRLNPGGFGGPVLVDHSNPSFTLADPLAKTLQVQTHQLISPVLCYSPLPAVR